MAQINCVDCLKTYRPYRYGIALLRVLMYGFSDWWEFEDEWVIEEHMREHLRNPNVKQRLINKTRTYGKDDSFAGDFNFYYQYLENKRRQKISATFLCFDCEKYYCTNCVSKHSGHFTFSKDDKYNMSKWGRISVEMLDRLKAEGDQKLENMKREKPLLCDIVDVRSDHDKLDFDDILWDLEQELEEYDITHGYNVVEWELDDLINARVEGFHILNDNKKWIARDDKNNCIKIFNVNDNKMTRHIKLSSRPHGITEIPSTDPSQSLIALSFPREKQIHVMNLHTTPAQVFAVINIQCECCDVAYCNNKLITMCENYQDGGWLGSIHVMDMSGEIINSIDVNNLPAFKLEMLCSCRMSVHSESETIYVCHWIDPSCVISLSLDGQVLYSVTFTDLTPALIHVDKDQNVYVMDDWLPIYKLSADLRHKEKTIISDVGHSPRIKAMLFYNDKFYLASNEGHVYIMQRGQCERIDENRPVQYARKVEQLNPKIRPTCKRRRQNVADRKCNLL